MQIRVLGSVGVEVNGSRVKLAGPKQRVVLSMLALNANLGFRPLTIFTILVRDASAGSGWRPALSTIPAGKS